jgi:cyclophilin family peptidyl-prolyl cis-trans isomerase
LPKFLVQFGISYSKNNELQSFAKKTIYDDPRQLLANNSNNQKIINFESGIISYAGNGPNSRTSHLFISYGSAPSLGTELWETPIGKVIGSGMIDVAENFYGGYGDEPRKFYTHVNKYRYY